MPRHGVRRLARLPEVPDLDGVVDAGADHLVGGVVERDGGHLRRVNVSVKIRDMNWAMKCTQESCTRQCFQYKSEMVNWAMKYRVYLVNVVDGVHGIPLPLVPHLDGAVVGARDDGGVAAAGGAHAVHVAAVALKALDAGA